MNRTGKPVRISRKGRSISFDLLSIERAWKAGTLSGRDRAVVQRFWPELFSRVLPEAQQARLKGLAGENPGTPQPDSTLAATPPLTGCST